jgi:Domain of unknown function (DUF4249)
MKNRILFSLKSAIAILIFIFYGCGEDFFDSVVEIDTKEPKPSLVVAAFWQTGTDSLAVFVSKSRGRKDKSPYNAKDTSPFGGFNQRNYDTVANTKVELFRNDQLLGEIPYLKVGYHLIKGKFKIESVSGVRYKIRVSAPNFPTIEAEQITQNPIKINQTYYKKNAAIFQDPDEPFGEPRKGDEFSFDIDDNAVDENYYTIGADRFQIEVTWLAKNQKDMQYAQNIFVKNLDPLAEADFLQDITFNGTVYRWRYFTPNFNAFQSGDRLFYTVWSHTKDWYLFNKTRNLLSQTQDNPFFSEPVILHTNIKGGQGIFSIYSKQKVVYTIK